MDRTRFSTLVILAAALGGGPIGMGIFSHAAMSQEAILEPTAVDPAQSPRVDAKSALPSAIALGYTNIRSAGLADELYQVVAVDSDGKIVRLYMDPQTGVVIKIEREKLSNLVP